MAQGEILRWKVGILKSWCLIIGEMAIFSKNPFQTGEY
jgi:hypothetical protein